MEIEQARYSPKGFILFYLRLNLERLAALRLCVGCNYGNDCSQLNQSNVTLKIDEKNVSRYTETEIREKAACKDL